MRRFVVRQQASGIVHDEHACGNVAYGSAKVDQRLAFAGRVPARNGRDADLKLERGGDAVARFITVVFVVLAVRMKVDEAGGNDESFGVDGGAALHRTL